MRTSWRRGRVWAVAMGRRALAVLVASPLWLGGCAADASPLEVELPSQSVAATSALSGSYESRVRLALGGEKSVYLVGVYFGDGARADGRTYLAQVGVSEAAGARLLMEQRSYTVVADSIGFGDLLQAGRLSADGSTLNAVVRVGTERVEVQLARR